MFKKYLLALMVGAATQVGAVIYDFNTVHSGDTPGGTAPYATLTVLQDGPDVVSLKLDAVGLTATEFISTFSYNIAGNALLTGYAAFDDGSGGVGPSVYVLRSFGAIDAGLSFDAEVQFPVANSGGGAQRFKDNESFSFKLTRSGLTVADIDLDMMIHIQGIQIPGTDGGSSKVIATERGESVPDGGSSLILIGLAGLGLLAARRR